MNQIRKLCRPGRLAFVLCMSLLSACTNEFWAEAPATTVGTPTSIVWKAPASAEQVARAQSLLTDLGFKPGPVDGKEGPMTAAAVREYQSAAGLPDDGRVSAPLVDHMAQAVETRQVVRAQRRLTKLGYNPGPIDGSAGPRTRSAVEAFQEASGGAKDGRITPRLLAALDSAGASSGGAMAEAEVTTETAAASPEAANPETASPEAVGAEAEQVTEEVAETATASAAVATEVVESAAETANETTGGTASETASTGVGTKTEELAALAPESDVLAAGDRLMVSYLGLEEKPVELQIGDDGSLALPKAGSVQAAGLGVAELRDRITVKLIESYMEKVDVEVGLAQAEGAEAGDTASKTLAPGDLVLVSMTGVESTSSQLEVGQDGSIDVPQAGSVQAAGLGLSELKQEISVKLLESYMGKLDVNVEQVE